MIHYTDDRVTVLHGDCIDELKTLPDSSVDAIVTDPPYAIGFMGRSWDTFKASDIPTGTACEECGNDDPTPGYRYCTDCLETLSDLALRESPMLGHQSQNWSEKATHSRGYADNDNAAFQRWCTLWGKEALRVLKPGGHILAFGGTRTFHRLTSGLEDAGFEIRDVLSWLYAQGFPKSLNIAKEIAKRSPESADRAADWEGWGTALKPSWEPIVLARKPVSEKTVAKNVLEHGTGAINIDATRVSFVSEADERESKVKNQHADFGSTVGTNEVYGDFSMVPPKNYNPPGRWPANVMLGHSEDCEQVSSGSLESVAPQEVSGGIWSESTGKPAGPVYKETAPLWECVEDCPVRILDEQSGITKSGAAGSKGTSGFAEGYDGDYTIPYGDRGGASRFFFSAKANKKERVEADGVKHPTVKPLALMRELIKLVAPEGGVVLDPFAGSGTTLEAAAQVGVKSIGVERDETYLKLIDKRIERFPE